ncbi:MAG TPA: adenosylcobinamide-GDP ribazoletransferase, partial [Chloroflexi bacterium]|nr:adenosylcobinamide-GDP ribazoletransferase [Chloroflexota bacterium]
MLPVANSRALRSALAFLTTLPIPSGDLDPADFAGAGRWFALVGVVIGALLVAVAWLATQFWPRDLA